MSRTLLVGLALLLASAVACGDLKNASEQPSTDAAAPTDDGGTSTDTDGGTLGPGVTVETLYTGRSRPGARSPEGFRPWRGGIAVAGDEVFWVESGTAPGLYHASTTPCATCVKLVSSLTRPSGFAATSTHAYVGDPRALKRYPFAGGAAQSLANAANDVLFAAADSTAVVWTTQDGAIERTVPGGATTTPINSNGDVVGMALAGGRVFWAGVDISGLNGLLQSVGIDGSSPRAHTALAGPFQAMGGNGTYLYYVTGTAGDVHRFTVSGFHDEVAEHDGLSVTDVAVDATYAYFAEAGDGDFTNGRVRRLEHGSKKAETIAASLAHPVAIAVSGPDVYVLLGGTQQNSYGDGAVVRIHQGN